MRYCEPGNVGQFVQAGVIALAEHPDMAAALGRNARQAAGTYSWTGTWRAFGDHSIRAKPKLRTAAGTEEGAR